jgi:hypothetical protein
MNAGRENTPSDESEDAPPHLANTNQPIKTIRDINLFTGTLQPAASTNLNSASLI